MPSSRQTPNPPKPKAPTMSEKQLTTAVIETAEHLNWWVVHFRPGMTSKGAWITAMQGSRAKGWPDLFMCRGPNRLAVELKVGGNKPSSEQQNWLDVLVAAGIPAMVWTDRDWFSGAIGRALR